jgi:hypothetical protein
MQHVGLGHSTPMAFKIAALSAFALMATCFVPPLAKGQANLLRNSDLSAGGNNTPDYWQHETYTPTPDSVTFESPDSLQPRDLQIWNYEPADSRWVQMLRLKQGWYHFTASVRTENVGEVDAGANISIMESWISSRNVTGSSYWEPIGFYLLAPSNADVKFACRLGFYSSENTGRAYFRDLSVTSVAEPANDGDPRFKLEFTPPSTQTGH